MIAGEMTIRSAEEGEGETIINMVREARLDPTQLRWQQFLVACQGEEIIGVGQLRRYGAVQELGSLVVLPAWRGQGIGGALIRALVAQREGALFLECSRSLSPYYEQFGFQVVNWYEVPWPLKMKFALSSFVGFFFEGISTMRYEPPISPPPASPSLPADRANRNSLLVLLW